MHRHMCSRDPKLLLVTGTSTVDLHRCTSVRPFVSMSMLRSSSAESAEGLLPRKDEAGPSHYESQGQTFRDPESLEDVPLVPGLNKLDNMLRWGFIKKVYGIISAQMILTVAVASIIIFNEPVEHFVTTSAPFQISVFAFSFLGLIPLYFYQRKHPLNLILLGVWTALLSVSVGTTCTFYQPLVVLEALALTAAIVVALTVYTFNAARKGANFSFLGPMLFGCLMALLVWTVFQIFFPPGPVQNTIFSLLGSILFSAYIVYDTDNLIQRFDLDQYIWASVTLYLDIINLFLKILQLLNGRRD